MKKKLLPLILPIFSLSVHAQTHTSAKQTDSMAIQTIVLPDSTAIGAPAGKPVSKEIGSEGGSIVSSDGKVELIFPKDALKSMTPIGIQPIDNLIPNGSGKAYRFEPSGIRFAKPVEINFHYSKEEAGACPPDLMFMAVQNDRGKWEYSSYEDWDSAGRSLKGHIDHFSAMVNGNLVELQPLEQDVRIGSSSRIYLTIVKLSGERTSVKTEPGEDELPALPQVASLGDEHASWLVNDAAGGTTQFGTIKPQQNKSEAVYRAPDVLPIDQIVTINLKTYLIFNEQKISRFGRKRGRMIEFSNRREYLATLTTTVHLYDLYDVKIVGSWDNSNGANRLGTTKWTDTSSFTLRVGHNPTISDISNSMLALVKENFTPRCQFEYLNRASCTGIIHINGLKGIGISGGSASPYTTALVQFTPAMSALPRVKIVCRGSPPFPDLPYPPLRAQPTMIKFDLKSGEQHQEMSDGLPGAKATVIIKQKR